MEYRWAWSQDHKLVSLKPGYLQKDSITTIEVCKSIRLSGSG
uniref:Uncharacterized protein n=1 Tax=Arundo donax TaxID=35708 RepID=A0A0A8ZRD9_ARUDO